MSDLRRTAQAEEDLIELWLYIAQGNPGAADRLLDEIADIFSRLADNGETHRTDREIVAIGGPEESLDRCTVVPYDTL